MSPLDECYAFCRDHGAKTHRAAAKIDKMKPYLGECTGCNRSDVIFIQCDEVKAQNARDGHSG
jgi:hypothetical protein